MTGLLDFIRTSFMHVLPILAAAVFALAIISERVRTLFLVYPISNLDGFFERIRELVMAGEIPEAVALCDRYKYKPVALVVKKALLRAHQPESLIESGLEVAVEDEARKIQKRTSFLAMIGNVATLLGLFGTIVGLVNSFKAVGAADAQEKASLLAQGISQAMHATMLGLGVAIPCLVAFSFLMNRSNQLVSEVETAAVRTLDMLKQRFFAAEKSVLNPTPTGGGTGKTRVA